MEPLGREFNLYFIWFLNEDRNNLNLITSFVAQFLLNVLDFQEIGYMSIGVFVLQPIELHKLSNHLNNVRLDFKIVSCNSQPNYA